MSSNIFPLQTEVIESNQSVLSQRGFVIWMVGLSGSGKSTLALQLQKHLRSEGFVTQLLDGDNLRAGINNNLGFSPSDRMENIRRTAEVAKLFAGCGIVTICSLITPTEEMRELVRSIIGAESYYEVYVDTSLEECERRDVKGLYMRARLGHIENFTGISSPFEIPAKPFGVIHTEGNTVQQSFEALLKIVEDDILFRKEELA